MTEVRSTSQYYYSLLPVHTFYCNHRFPCLYCVFTFSITFSTKACIPDVVNNLEPVDLGEETAIAYLQLLINLAVTSAWHNDIVRAAPRAVALLQMQSYRYLSDMLSMDHYLCTLHLPQSCCENLEHLAVRNIGCSMLVLMNSVVSQYFE